MILDLLLQHRRYLDGLDEETRASVIKRYIPDEPFGGGRDAEAMLRANVVGASTRVGGRYLGNVPVLCLMSRGFIDVHQRIHEVSYLCD